MDWLQIPDWILKGGGGCALYWFLLQAYKQWASNHQAGDTLELTATENLIKHLQDEVKRQDALLETKRQRIDDLQGEMRACDRERIAAVTHLEILRRECDQQLKTLAAREARLERLESLLDSSRHERRTTQIIPADDTRAAPE